MKIFTAAFAASAAVAVVLAAAPTRAAESQEAALRLAGDRLLSMSDQDYRDLGARPEASSATWTKLDRPAMLGATYRRLAEIRYRAALDGGLDPDLKPQAEAALGGLTKAGRSVGGDAELIQPAGWGDVAAVRGGRKLSTDDDREVSSLLASVDAGDKALDDGAATPAKRAQTQFEAGRQYEKIAAIVSKPAPADAAPAAADAPAKTLSAKEIYQKDAPSVVLILAGRPTGQGELGTGSVIDASGRVLTNAHVIVDDKTGRPYPSIRVYMKPAKITGDPKEDLADPISAKAARYDRALDLALLELDRTPHAPALALGDDAGVETGDPVVAIGHPEQGGLWTLTQGVVSTVLADLGGVPGKDAFQTDASINRGNSGGPLIARSGTIIGINTSMARKAADGLTITSVNFSIKSSVARRWLDGESRPAAVAAAPVASLPPAPKTKPVMVTPAKPYREEDLLQQQMKEMDDLGEEMHEEIQRRLQTP